MYPIENARGFKGDKTIVKTETVIDKEGNTVEYQYNADGVCLVARIVKFAK